MIKTETLIKHTVVCPHCKGKIVVNNVKKNEFTTLYSRGFRGQSESFNFEPVATPQCEKCGRKYEVKVNVLNEITIEIKELDC